MDYVEPVIDLCVPHEPGGLVGKACNRILNESVRDWVLLHDSDVFLKTHPNFYWVCQQAILEYPDAGLFTCKCNDICNRYQLDKKAPKSDSLGAHINYARTVWEEHRMEVQEINSFLSGFFLLVNRKKALKVGGFPGVGQFREDNYFSKRMYKKYKCYLLKGLYLFHERDREHGTFVDEDKTAKEYCKAKKPEKRESPSHGVLRKRRKL